MSRIIEFGSKKYTQAVCLDEQGAGGACHKYEVRALPSPGSFSDTDVFARVSFQNGPIKENGVNGCHQEDLLAIVIDRLQCFQKGEFACRENAIALTKVEEALMWLRKRTQDRIDRGVEGTSNK
jgi:hypothetical protein